MKTIDPRKVIMTLGGILIATLAAGCFGGGAGYIGTALPATIAVTAAMEAPILTAAPTSTP